MRNRRVFCIEHNLFYIKSIIILKLNCTCILYQFIEPIFVTLNKLILNIKQKGFKDSNKWWYFIGLTKGISVLTLYVGFVITSIWIIVSLWIDNLSLGIQGQLISGNVSLSHAHTRVAAAASWPDFYSLLSWMVGTNEEKKHV